MKKISTSISTFRNLIESDCLYVDKTKYIYDMVKEPFGQFFFSRPRRFGKSLTVSTLESVFLGEKELFEGLYIYDKDYSWDTFPIIHIDFGKSDSSTVASLEEWLKLEMTGIASKNEVQIGGSSPALMFGELIKALNNKYNKGVVILIDEYDRPITNNIEDGKGVKKIRQVMEAFYQMIKGYESIERFVFITGITKLSQVSIFSKLNNLSDISRNRNFADAVGYTQEELDEYFHDYIVAGADKNGITYDELKKKLALWYDGFRFTFDGEKVYNPVSIGRFMNEDFEFRNYWYATATPVMLVNQARKQNITVETIENAVMTDISYNSFDIMQLSTDNVDSQSLIQLLYQTGYLTIGEKEEKNSIPTYKLIYPNKEVKDSFETDLASVYMNKAVGEISNFTNLIQSAAYEGNIERMIEILKGIFAGVPYDVQLNYEKYYQSLLYLTFRMCGMDIIAEKATNIGRIDAELISGKNIYVIECKINKTAQEAIKQIEDKKYCEKSILKKEEGYKIYKVGMNFSTNKGVRNIDDWMCVEA